MGRGEEWRVDTRDCIEKVILEKLRELTLGKVREDLAKEDQELENKMRDLQFLTADNLEVADVCKQNPDTMDTVTQQLQQIQNVGSPGEKVADGRGSER